MSSRKRPLVSRVAGTPPYYLILQGQGLARMLMLSYSVFKQLLSGSLWILSQAHKRSLLNVVMCFISVLTRWKLCNNIFCGLKQVTLFYLFLFTTCISLLKPPRSLNWTLTWMEINTLPANKSFPLYVFSMPHNILQYKWCFYLCNVSSVTEYKVTMFLAISVFILSCE